MTPKAERIVHLIEELQQHAGSLTPAEAFEIAQHFARLDVLAQREEGRLTDVKGVNLWADDGKVTYRLHVEVPT